MRTVLETLEDDEPIQLASAPKATPLNRWGFQVEALSQEMAEQLDAESGLVITEVEPRGVAAEQGLQPGDVILEVNNEKVNSTEELEKALGEAASSSLLVQRNGSTFYRGLERE